MPAQSRATCCCPDRGVLMYCAVQVPSAVGVTTQAAVQVAQAAQAVSQQAASLHAAAEVHAAKAHAATSQVQSLQATAQVGCGVWGAEDQEGAWRWVLLVFP